MPKDAFERLADYGWEPRSFSDSIQELYPNVIAAVEDTFQENTYKITILTEETIDIASCRIEHAESKRYFNPSIKSYPISKITNILIEYKNLGFRPRESLDLDEMRKRLTISISGENISIDFRDLDNDTEDAHNDLDKLISELKKRV